MYLYHHDYSAQVDSKHHKEVMKYLLKSRYLLNVETLLYVYGFSSHGGLLSWIAQASAGVWYIVENALTC